jgi:hypothetical protein
MERGKASRIGALILALGIFLLYSGGCSTSGKNPPAGLGARVTSPITGRPLSHPESSRRRALAVKVENTPQARPQSGLSAAELVFEELVEGMITRYTAVYLDEEAEEIGPVRSARPTDADLLLHFHPLLATSGASPTAEHHIKKTGLDYVTEADEPSCFWRARDRRAPHNLYTSTSRLREYLERKGLEGFGWTDDLFTFGEPRTGLKAAEIRVDYPSSYAITYRYDASSRTYLRFLGGEPHMDRLTGRQVAPTTVIIFYAVMEDRGVRDMAGELSPDAITTGSYHATIFTGGTALHGRWERNKLEDRFRFYDFEGNELPIPPGQVWVHVIPMNIKVEYK